MDKKKILWFLVILVLLFVSALLAIAYGSSQLEFKDIIYTVLHPGAQTQTAAIVWQMRFPRMILGFLVGAGLACCGVVFQAVLRNGLAEPYTLGVANGAALGAVAGTLMNLGSMGIAALSFAGSLITIFLVYSIAYKKNFSNSALILGGVTLGFLFSSMLLFTFAISRREGIYGALIWLMGDLSYAKPELVKIASIFILPGILLLVFFGRDIDILCMGEEKARYLGINVVMAKKILFLISSIITAACVSCTGVIGFVGLIIPHTARFLFGINHRRLLFAAVIMGAAFVMFCDMLARTIIRPLELPVGIITGIFGGIFFLSILLRSKKNVSF